MTLRTDTHRNDTGLEGHGAHMKTEAKSLATKSETNAALSESAWRSARDKVQAIRAVQVKNARGFDAIEAHAKEADLYEAEAECLRLEAEATSAIEARDLEQGDETATAMSIAGMLSTMRPLVDRLAALRSEVARSEYQIGETFRTATAAHQTATAQRIASDLPPVRTSVLSPDVQNAPTFEAMIAVLEAADPSHGLPALARAKEFDERAKGARARENTLRVEREIERRADAARAQEAAAARAERDRIATQRILADVAERKREADARAQEARQHAELLEADLKRTARAS